MVSVPGYRLIDEVASGASGTVYRAIQESLGRAVAVKILAPGLFDAAQTRSRFTREARLQASLSHANLVALFDWGFTGDRPFLVTEFVTGGTLRQLLERSGRLETRDALRLALGVARGLEAAHGASIVHRDLKPENILMADGGLPKVADFGLAKALLADQSILTASGLVLGTPGYIAPESILGHASGAAVDLYALGVVLFEMLAGRRPFVEADLADTLRRQTEETAPALSEFRSGMPAALVELIVRCLAREPADRPGSAGEVADAIEALEKSIPAAGAVPATAVLNPSRKRDSGSRGAHSAATRVQPAPRMSPAAPHAVTWTLDWRARLATAGLGAGMLALAALLSFRAGDRPGVAEVVPPAPRAERAIAPALPAVSRITVRHERGRLWLSAAAPKGLKAAYRRATAATGSIVEIQEGRRDITLVQLEPDTAYTGDLELGTRKSGFHFRTLPMLDSSGSTIVATGRCANPVMRLRGESAALAWVENRGSKTDSAIRVRRSPDRGLTWEATECLARGYVSGPGLAWTDAGLLATWVLEGRRRIGTRLYSSQSRSWSSTVSEPFGNLWLGPDGATAIDALAEHGPTEDSRRGLVRVAAGRDGRPVFSPVRTELPAGDYLSTLVRSGGHFLAFAGSGQNEETLFRTALDDRPEARWSPLERVTPPGFGAGRSHMDVVGSPPGVVLAYTEHLNIVIQVSRDHGRTFSAPRPISPLRHILGTRTSATLAVDGRKFLLCCLESGIKSQSVLLYGSDTGESWKLMRRMRIPITFPSGVSGSLAASGGAALCAIRGNESQGLAVYAFHAPSPPDPR